MYVYKEKKERQLQVFVWFSLSYRLLEDLSVEILEAWVESREI